MCAPQARQQPRAPGPVGAGPPERPSPSCSRARPGSHPEACSRPPAMHFFVFTAAAEPVVAPSGRQPAKQQIEHVVRGPSRWRTAGDLLPNVAPLPGAVQLSATACGATSREAPCPASALQQASVNCHGAALDTTAPARPSSKLADVARQPIPLERPEASSENPTVREESSGQCCPGRERLPSLPNGGGD